MSGDPIELDEGEREIDCDPDDPHYGLPPIRYDTADAYRRLFGQGPVAP